MLHLHLVFANHADGQGFALEAIAGHGRQGGIVDHDALGGWPFVVAIGKVVLRCGAGQVFQKLHRIALVFGVFGHGATGDVDVCAPAGLVGKHHADFAGDGLVGRVFGAQDTRHVIGVGYRDGTFARSHAFDLVGVAAFGVAREVVHHAFEPVLRLGIAQVFGHRAKQAQVVGVRARTDAQAAFVDRVCQLFVAVNIGFFDLQFVIHDDAGAGRQAKPRCAAIRSRCGTQNNRNGVFQHFGFDRLKQAFDLALVKPGCVDQQDHVGR